MINMNIEAIPPYRVAYIRHTGPYGAGNTQTMASLKSWAKTNSLLDETAVILGIARDNPETTAPGHCRYDACLVIAEDYYVHDDTVCQGSIPGGSYAVFKILHTAEAVQRAWLEIFPELAGRGCLPDETRPILERYKAEMVKNHTCEICVPIL